MAADFPQMNAEKVNSKGPSLAVPMIREGDADGRRFSASECEEGR
jgi:hypothetical protein